MISKPPETKDTTLPVNVRRTKVICTIGPATASYPKLEALYAAGMNVVRLNMSHADHKSAAKIIGWIKTLNRKVRYPVPILLDTQGPEIRTGVRAAPIELKKGQRIRLTVVPNEEQDPKQIFINYPDLVRTAAEGDRISLDNGLLSLRVVERGMEFLSCEVLDGGVVGDRRHVNLPGIHVNLPAITEKDQADIEFGAANDIDYVALSFVREANDIVALRKLLGSKASAIKIIAKIEDREGVSNIDDIIQAADGVMVARGDLGIETDISELPNVQRRIVEACVKAGKRSIVATHLLESMIDNPIPTRAEVTDVANAIYEGVDGIMLSGETSVGKYPERCVQQLDAIARSSERYPGLGFHKELHVDTDKQHIAIHAVALAEAIGAAGLVVITRRGITADLVTNCRPTNVPIFAFTNHSQTRRRLALNRAVFAHRTQFSKDPEKTLQTAFRVLREREHLASYSKIVVISDVLAEQRIDAIQIRTLEQD